ncbi:MAG: M28 family peptidase, partial [Anaerolineaceae bacterium]
ALGFVINRLVRGNLFNGRQAYEDVSTQISFGPRTPGSDAHKKVGDWILMELKDAGWQTEEQITEIEGHSIRNLIAKRGSGSPWYIFGAHYDSRLEASQDVNPANRSLPVPGANDGASGVAVLLGLARVLPEDLPGQVWLVFFDAEDQGNLPGWDWILGSRYFADTLQGKPDGVVVVDMVGDSNLQIYKERNSDPVLMDEIWGIADHNGFSRQFLPEFLHKMLDDHLPFLEKGIPAALLIDFDYPWWHTTSDTLDKVSASSLDAVGETLYRWTIQKMKE